MAVRDIAVGNTEIKMENVLMFYLYRREGATGELTQIAGAYGSLHGAKKTIEDQIGSVNYEVEADQVFAAANGVRVFRIHCVRLD
jgi:hypothetical protein